MQMPKDKTMTIIQTNPHGNCFRSPCDSSQYRSQVKYQHVARFNSSAIPNQICRRLNKPASRLPSISLKSFRDKLTSRPAMQSLTRISHFVLSFCSSSGLQLAFRCWMCTFLWCIRLITLGEAESIMSVWHVLLAFWDLSTSPKIILATPIQGIKKTSSCFMRSWSYSNNRRMS